MIRPVSALISSVFLTSIGLTQEISNRWTLDFETGLSSSRYNSARVPNPGGTDVNLASVLGRNWRPFGRVALAYRDASQGTWKVLYAPFRQTGTGVLTGPTSFAGQTFAPGSVNAGYQFDSYRLTYRKPWRGNWSLGATLKVRAAQIRLVQGGTVGAERNVGLVPLLHVFGSGSLTNDIGYEIEMDGLAGGPGRAIDLSFRATKNLGPKATGFVGLRVLEGGADVPKVKNFAWVSYLTAGVSIKF